MTGTARAGAKTEAVLERLGRGHAPGDQSIRELQHAPLGFQTMGEGDQRHTRREKFETAMSLHDPTSGMRVRCVVC